MKEDVVLFMRSAAKWKNIDAEMEKCNSLRYKTGIV